MNALMFAVRQPKLRDGLVDVIQFLIEENIDLNCETNFREKKFTTFSFTMHYKFYEIAALLCEYGCTCTIDKTWNVEILGCWNLKCWNPQNANSF